VATSVCEENGISFCCSEFQLPPFCPLDALSGTGFQCSDDLTKDAPDNHPSYIGQEGGAIDCAMLVCTGVVSAGE